MLVKKLTKKSFEINVLIYKSLIDSLRLFALRKLFI